MDETKITAALPNLDVEFTRRESPQGDAETITLRMTATPSFEAVADHLMKPGVFPFLPPGPALMMNLWATPMANPFVLWAQMAQAAWQPLLQHSTPAVTQRSGDGDTDRGE